MNLITSLYSHTLKDIRSQENFTFNKIFLAQSDVNKCFSKDFNIIMWGSWASILTKSFQWMSPVPHRGLNIKEGFFFLLILKLEIYLHRASLPGDADIFLSHLRLKYSIYSKAFQTKKRQQGMTLIKQIQNHFLAIVSFSLPCRWM